MLHEAASVSFIIPGVLRGKQRPRSSRGGRMYTPIETVNAEAFVKLRAVEAMGEMEPMTAPICMTVAITVAVPASYSRKKRAAALAGDIRPTKKPDLDNCIKLLADAMNGVAYRDDCQIVSMIVQKSFGADAQTRVTLGPLTASSC